MKGFFLIIILLILSPVVKAQVLEKSAVFPTATGNLEPDGRKELVRVSDNEFVVITKIKGSTITESSFVLEKYDKDLNVKFTVPVIAGLHEDFKELFFNGTDLILFSVIHETEIKKTKLLAYFFDVNTGVKKSEKLIHEMTVKDWLPSMGKGAVKETFDNAICSALVHAYVTPLQYQYEIRYSPDKQKIVTYIFDYGQKALVAQALVLDNKLNMLVQGMVPIDNGFINYGIYPNNKGDIFILNGDRGGRIVVIEYNLGNHESNFLDIQSASTRRESLVLQVLNDDMVYVGNTNTSGGKLAGVMYSKFNFKDNLVEKINYHDLTDGVKQTVDASRSGMKMSGPESWFGYEIVDFFVNEYEKVIFMVEKRELQDPNTPYDPSAVNDIKHWTERLSKVNVETILMFSFTPEDELIWENCYVKSQTNEVVAGMISASFSYNITADGKIRMLYSSADNPAMGYNKITYVEWEELSGTRVKDVKLNDPEEMGMMRAYTVWWEDRVIVAGRKGLFGKKSFVNLYKF